MTDHVENHIGTESNFEGRPVHEQHAVTTNHRGISGNGSTTGKTPALEPLKNINQLGLLFPICGKRQAGSKPASQKWWTNCYITNDEHLQHLFAVWPWKSMTIVHFEWKVYVLSGTYSEVILPPHFLSVCVNLGEWVWVCRQKCTKMVGELGLGDADFMAIRYGVTQKARKKVVEL